MKYSWLGCLLFGSLLFAGTQDSEFNVNTRYTVETVVVSGDGWSTELAADRGGEGKISSSLRKEIAAIIGQKLNPAALDDLAKRLRKEFNARTVEHHVLRGKSPGLRAGDFRHPVPAHPLRSFHSQVALPLQAEDGPARSKAPPPFVTMDLPFGLVSDGDELLEALHRRGGPLRESASSGATGSASASSSKAITSSGTEH